MTTTKFIILLLFVLSTFAKVSESAKKVHYIHWNRANPLFRLDNTDHMIDVNVGNQPWEYDQVNLICPMSKPGRLYPESHVIYSVSREEYDSCRITNPKPKIVAVCSQPHQLLYFTITFRSFTPTPGGLEFYPGQDYYFISTSSREDLHRRVGGGCATHNMKMIFRVADNSRKNLGQDDSVLDQDLRNNLVEEEEISTTTTTTEEPKKYGNHGRRYKYQKNPAQTQLNSRNNEIYYYHPRDLIEVDTNSVYSSNLGNQNKNQYWKTNEALQYTSGAFGLGSSIFGLVLALSSILAFC